MRFFLHNSEIVKITDGITSFECTPARFAILEPEYPALGAGRILRYWTNEYKYEADADGLHYACEVNCGGYVDNILNYTTYPQIFAHCTLSQDALCVNADPAETIVFDVHLKGSIDPEADDIPIDYNWKIRLTHESNVRFDAFLADFVQGECQKNYVYSIGIPLGDWFVEEDLFDLVEFYGVEYEVKLAQPVKFTLYREFS